MYLAGALLSGNGAQEEEESDGQQCCGTSGGTHPVQCQHPGIELHGTEAAAIESLDRGCCSSQPDSISNAPAGSVKKSSQSSSAPGLTVRELLGMGRRMASSLLQRMRLKPQKQTSLTAQTFSPAGSSEASGPILVDLHALENMREAAREYVTQALDSLDTQDAQDPTLSASRLAGRMVGKEAYAHPHTHKLDAQTPSPDTYETVPNSGTARRRNLRVMVRDMKDGAKAVGHTMTHLPQAASEIAGRMMGKDNYEHPGSPHLIKPASQTPKGRHGRSSSCSTVCSSTPRPSFEVTNSSSSAPEVNVLLPSDLQPPAQVDSLPLDKNSTQNVTAKKNE